jgi:5-methylcytosine-specific restriction endonuclease McrA
MKLCSKCHSPGDFSPSKSARDGLASWCKKCVAQDQRDRRARDPEKAKAAQRRWYANHIEEMRARDKIRFQNPLRKQFAYDSNKRRRLNHPEEVRAYGRAYKRVWRVVRSESSREIERIWKDENRDKLSLYSKRWRARNPEKVTAANASRRARLKAAPGAYTASDVRDCLVTQGARCFYCLASLADGYHVDHMTPLARGGSNGPENIVCSCPTCNSKKYTRTAAEFILGVP